MKKILSALVLSLTFLQLAFAATAVDTGYITDGIDTMTGVTMQNGQMYTTWSNSAPLQMLNNAIMANGTKVMPNGYVVMSNGSTSWMTEGESMNLNGQITNIGHISVPNVIVADVTTPAPAVVSTMYGLRYVGAPLNVRSWAGVGANRIGYLTPGTTVNVLSKSSNGWWCQIDSKNYSHAWVACRYLMK